MSIRFAITLAVFALPMACATATASIDAVAAGYVRAALQLAQHDPSLVEQWRGPDTFNPGPRVPVAGLLANIRHLQEELNRAAADTPPPQARARRQYLEAQLRALAFAAERQLGRATTIDEQLREEFGIEPPAVDAGAIARAHEALHAALPGEASLHDKVLTLRRATTIPRAQRAAAIEVALDACRQATARQLPVTAGANVTIVFRANMPWDAFARYQGGGRTEIAINDAGELDVSRAFRLACHEGYPGHHVQHVMIDRLADERGWPELRLTPGFGPHLLFTEGAAELAADLVLSPGERAQLYRDRLFTASGVNAGFIDGLIAVEEYAPVLLPVVTEVARAYLAGTIDRATAIARLEQDALVSNAAGTLAFIEQRRARALVYGEGRRVLGAALATRDLAGLYDAFRRAAALQ